VFACNIKKSKYLAMPAFGRFCSFEVNLQTIIPKDMQSCFLFDFENWLHQTVFIKML